MEAILFCILYSMYPFTFFMEAILLCILSSMYPITFFMEAILSCILATKPRLFSLTQHKFCFFGVGFFSGHCNSSELDSARFWTFDKQDLVYEVLVLQFFVCVLYTQMHQKVHSFVDIFEYLIVFPQNNNQGTGQASLCPL